MSENEYQVDSSLVKLTHVLLLFRECAFWFKTDSQNTSSILIIAQYQTKMARDVISLSHTHMPVAEMKYQDIQYLVFMYDQLRSYLKSSLNVYYFPAPSPGF